MCGADCWTLAYNSKAENGLPAPKATTRFEGSKKLDAAKLADPAVNAKLRSNLSAIIMDQTVVPENIGGS